MIHDSTLKQFWHNNKLEKKMYGFQYNGYIYICQSVNLLGNLINSIITNILPEDNWAASIKP